MATGNRGKSSSSFDVIVIGAGAGGLLAAARLAAAGRQVLVLERRDRLGGRAGVADVDGFLLNDGAVLVETKNVTEATFRDLGVPLRLYAPRRALMIRAGKRDISLSEGFPAAILRAGLATARLALRWFPRFRPRAEINTEEWLNGITRSKFVHGLVGNMCAALFATEPGSVPARFFLDYFTKPGALKSFGFAPGGTGAIWPPLAEIVERFGGSVLLNTEVIEIVRDYDQADFRVLAESPKGRSEFTAPQVINDAGPAALLRLARSVLPPDVATRLRAADTPSALITIHFASRAPLAQFPALMLFSRSRRLAYAGNFSVPGLGRVPAGWYLYSGASAPRPATGDFDQEREIELLQQDLREQFPGFEDARILRIDVARGDWPGARSQPGTTVPPDTSIPGLWNVGDGASQWAAAGISATAESAEIVVKSILAESH